MRASFKDRVCGNIAETPVKNHFVVGATSKVEIPIRAKFLANLSSNGTVLGKNKTVVYVVNNTEGRDIVCDVIVGRPSLAWSDYHCIDTKNATLFNPNNQKLIQCSPACLVNTAERKDVGPT